jgi:glycosyltransferase involved in cell wall biosynthesis
MKLSIVIPAFNESANVFLFHERLCSVLSQLSLQFSDFQLIYVDDNSTDDTVKRLKQIKMFDSRVEILQNSRNYGVYRSTFSALKFCNGDWVLPMLPIDGQDPPEVILEMAKELNDNFLVISGARYERDEKFLMRSLRRFYYRFVSRFSSYEVPAFVGEFQLVHKSVIDKLCQINDYYPYTRALIARMTSRRKVIYYRWEKRTQGASKHNFLALYDQAINGIISTSATFLRFLTLLGLVLTVFCFFFVLVQIVTTLFGFAIAPPGISTLIVGMFFLFGVLFIFLGLIGEYIGAIHAQVRQGFEVHTSKVEE